MNGWDEERTEPAKGEEKGREPAKRRTATATATSRRGAKKVTWFLFFSLSEIIGGRKSHFGGEKTGLKKLISGGEKNKVVGRPHAGGQKK